MQRETLQLVVAGAQNENLVLAWVWVMKELRQAEVVDNLNDSTRCLVSDLSWWWAIDAA